MTRAVLLVVPLFLWLVSTPLSLAPTLEAAPYKCILTNSCTPPSCEFLNELKFERAGARILARVRAPLSSSDKAFQRFNKALRQEVGAEMRKYKAQYSKCGFPDYPSISVSDRCELGVLDGAGSVQPKTLDDVLRVSSGCSEAAEAEYAAAQSLQSMCNSVKPDETVAVARARALLNQQAKVDSLEQSLQRYLNSCKPDSKTARQIANMGLSRLLRAGQKARGETLGKWVASQNVLGATGGAIR
jgi:hypothetical protein